MADEKYIGIASIKAVGIAPNYSGAKLAVVDKNNTELMIEFPAPLLLSLIEYLSLASFSINKQKGGIECLPVEKAQTHSLGDAIGVEIAFASRGLLYFGFPHNVARELHLELGGRLQEVPPGEPIAAH